MGINNDISVKLNTSSLINNLRNSFVNNYNYRSDKVFLVNDTTLAKHGREDEGLGELVSEYKMGNRLYTSLISVPKFHNLTWLKPEQENEYDQKLINMTESEKIIHKVLLYAAKVSKDRDIFYNGNWFLIMDKLHGDEITFMTPDQRKVATRLLKKELYKVLDLGICPHKDALYCGNSIYNPDENRIYLIDFEGWCDGSKVDIGNFAKMLSQPIYMSGLFERKNHYISKVTSKKNVLVELV